VDQLDVVLGGEPSSGVGEHVGGGVRSDPPVTTRREDRADAADAAADLEDVVAKDAHGVLEHRGGRPRRLGVGILVGRPDHGELRERLSTDSRSHVAA
jgi:hypothetical protein